MRSSNLKLVIVGIASAISLAAQAESISLHSVADTNISRHSGLGSGVTPQGNSGSLSLISPTYYESFPLIRFDLGALAGRTVQSDATLGLTYQSYFADTNMNISIYAADRAWNEATATWNNYPRPAGSPLLTQYLDVAGMAAGTRINFTITQALVQQWIDSPANNYGLFLYTGDGWNSRDINFASREYAPTGGQAGDWGPRLSFAANDLSSQVPEPGSLLLAVIGLGAFSAMRRRKAAQA